MCSLAHIVPLSWDMTFGLHVKAVCCFIVHEVELCNCELSQCHCGPLASNAMDDNVPLSWEMTVGLHVKAVCCFIVNEVEVCNCELSQCGP